MEIVSWEIIAFFLFVFLLLGANNKTWLYEIIEIFSRIIVTSFSVADNWNLTGITKIHNQPADQTRISKHIAKVSI